MTEEAWLPVPEDGRYLVSNMGNVRGPKGRVLKPGLAGAGYPFVQLGRQRSRYIHRLVVSAFIGPIPEGMQVNHKSGLKTDNRVENLEIVSASGNRSHAWQHLGHYRNRKVRDQSGDKHNMAKLLEGDALAIRRLHREGVRSGEIAQQFGITRAHVWQITSGKRWAHLQSG